MAKVTAKKQPRAERTSAAVSSGRSALRKAGPAAAAARKAARSKQGGMSRVEEKSSASSPAPVSVVPTLGRPPNTPDKWTDEYVALVIADMERYINSTAYPTEAEFCYTRHIHPQRLNENAALREAKVMMQAKRQAKIIERGFALKPGEAPLCSFLRRMMSHAGPFSLTDKTEVDLNQGSDVASMTPEEREERLNALLARQAAK